MADFQRLLVQLKCNSKNVIDVLTNFAKSNINDAENIFSVIENQINGSNGLLMLYLIDSIIKNVGAVYVTLFKNVMMNIFSEIFKIAESETRIKMYKLRHTWNGIISARLLHSLDVEIREIDPGWPIVNFEKVFFVIVLVNICRREVLDMDSARSFFCLSVRLSVRDT